MDSHDWQHILEMVYPQEIPERTRARGPAAIRTLRQFRTRHRAWIDQSGITGFAIGEKRVGTQLLSRPSLVVMVDRKLPPNQCPNPVPRYLDFPKFKGVETDVQEFPAVEAQHFHHRYRPLRPGVGIGFHKRDSGPGTMGCFVRSTRPGESSLHFLLSCEHVLYNDLRERDDINSATGKLPRTVCHPAPKYASPTGENEGIAVLRRAGGVVFDGGINFIDAAVAQLARSEIPGKNTPLPNLPPLGEPMLPRANQEVYMIGAVSEKLSGTIIHTNVSTDIHYRGESEGAPLRPARFIGLVSYQCDTSPGDSGGPVVDAATNRILGIHVAGSGNRAVFCPIHRIFSILELRLYVAE